MSRLFSLKILIFSFLLFAVSSCEKQNSISVDSRGIAPIFVNASLSTAIINTDSINNKDGLRLPEDVLSLNLNVFARTYTNVPTAPHVLFTLRKEETSAITASGLLADNGVIPDVAKNDSIYSALVTFQIVRSTVGKFIMEVWAQSSEGYASSAFLLPLQIIRANQPPVLSNLQAPDTVKTSTQTSFVITVKAADPDGLADIRSVTRTTPSGLVLQLNDSGVNGDQTANDGIYTETVSMVPPPPAGNYDFKFQAFDRSNAASNIIIRRVTVIP